MKKVTQIAAGLVLALTHGHVALADNKARSAEDNAETRKEINTTLERATTVYKSIVSNSSKRVPTGVVNKAECIAVFPDVVSAAVGVGGVHGDGVAFCKAKAGETNGGSGWGSPVFLNLTGASLGAQIGARSSDLVLFMTGERAKTAIKEGRLSLSGELSAVAGSFDESISIPTSGVVAYTNTAGVFAGAALGGVDISRDDEEQRAMYGTGADTAPVFSRKVPEQQQVAVNELKSLLPGA